MTTGVAVQATLSLLCVGAPSFQNVCCSCSASNHNQDESWQSRCCCCDSCDSSCIGIRNKWMSCTFAGDVFVLEDQPTQREGCTVCHVTIGETGLRVNSVGMELTSHSPINLPCTLLALRLRLTVLKYSPRETPTWWLRK